MDRANTQPSRIFISYRRDVEPDESLALKVVEALSKDHVFIDQNMRVGTNWEQRVEAAYEREEERTASGDVTNGRII